MATLSNSDDASRALSNQVVTLVADIELPWPKDIFGEVPEDEWHEIDEFAKTRGYRIDTISGDLMRRGWRVFRRQLLERVSDLADTDLEAIEELIKSAQDNRGGDKDRGIV